MYLEEIIMKDRRLRSAVLLWMRTVVCAVVAVSVVACGDDSKRFREAMNEGNLSEAEECLADMSEQSDCQQGALQLIRAYLSVDEPEKAILVYENITPWHKDRYEMQWSRGDYERNVCQLLRDYLVKNGDYERAWAYYPLDYEGENYAGNAQSRYAYISDVVAAMCAKGEQEEARRFVESQLRWFVTYVDSITGETMAAERAGFNSSVVRDNLYAQIDNPY